MGLPSLCYDSLRSLEGGFSGCDLFNGLEVCNEKFHLLLLECAFSSLIGPLLGALWEPVGVLYVSIY